MIKITVHTLPFLLFVFILTLNHSVHSANLLNSNSQNSNSNNNNNNAYVNARIQCEYKDLDGESLILNCTLTNGQSANNLNNNNVNNINSNLNPINNNLDLSSENHLNSGQSLSNSLNVKVGLDRQWRTPWESLSINLNIITTLIWRRSRLSELGEWAFKDLNYLQRIDLSHNKLQSLSPYSFSRLELNLIELDLSHNQFQQLPQDLFQQKRMQHLEVLRLNENPIVYLHRKNFEAIRSSLKTLELNYCQIRSIDVNTFDDMKQLESLSIIGNHLRYLNEYTFRDLSLRSFYLHDNPLVCDCHMRWLINYLKNVDYQQQTYESQIVLTNQQQSMNNNQLQQQRNMYNLQQTEVASTQYNSYIPSLSVAAAAQQLLRCDQPNSLKSHPNFLDINPDSFMCDVQISFRDSVTESLHEVGEDAVLICDVYGDPEPNVYWSFGQNFIEKALNNEADKYYVHETRSYAMSPFRASQLLASSSSTTNKTSQLRIKNLQPADFGVYACTAEISGSNNRKQMKFTLKQERTGLTGGIVVNSVHNFLAAATSTLFHGGNRNNGGKPLSNWTLVLLLAIFISIILFVLMLSSFVCWKCRRSSRHRKNEIMSKRLLTEQMLIRGKEDEKLLMSHSVVDGHHNQSKLLHSHQLNGADYGQHPSQMSNNSSATLMHNHNHNNNNMSSSIRMAYPNNQHLNDIYANHSLLTTTSTTTGSYLAGNTNSQAIAIDTSNHTPRYHLLHMQPTISHQQQANGVIESYYDDLRYHHLDENGNGVQPAIYSSPYKNHHSQQMQQYSPVTRRDDPTVPLYATLKPKHHQRQPQHPNYSNSYLPYSTIQRGAFNNTQIHNHTPPLPLPRNPIQAKQQHQQQQQHLPPPPPPPPLKPKRTFEYVIGTASRDLHSESGAFLLAASDDYDQANELLVCPPHQADYHKVHNKHFKNVTGEQGSTTSLDEEDLDLNDLKDFEDVTFDNLRKPGEQNGRNSHANSKSNHNLKEPQQKQLNTKHFKPNDDINNINNTNSEQSLLLKSSGSSSDSNTINNEETTKKSDPHKKSNNTQTTLVSNQYETNSTSTDLNCNSDELNSKVYEETEI